MSKNLIARLAVAAVAIPAILWIVYQGENWLFGMLLGFALLGLGEFLINEGIRPTGGLFWTGVATLLITFWTISEYSVFGLSAASWLVITFGEGGALISLVLFFAITSMVLAIGKKSPADLFTRHSRYLWGVIYLSCLYPVAFRVGQEYAGIVGGDWLLFLFGLLWVGDTAAMFIGRAIGKHKLAPTVSPNKTVEGFIGGIVGSLAVAVLLFFWKLSSVGLGHILTIAVLCSIFGQLGDLVESMWKRSLGIKDSSALIPGHGGVLDRFDSLLFAAPVLFVYLRLMM